MTTYEAKLEGREEIAEGTMAFYYEKPAGFSFKAGQAVAHAGADMKMASVAMVARPGWPATERIRNTGEDSIFFGFGLYR